MSKRTSHSPPGVTPPAIGEGKRGEAGYLGYLLRQAAHAQRKRMDRILAPLGLTHPQFLVLIMIRAYPGCSNAELARLTMLTPQTVHAIVAALLQREWVARQAPPAHGRVRPLELSASGEQQLDRARRAAQRSPWRGARSTHSAPRSSPSCGAGWSSWRGMALTGKSASALGSRRAPRDSPR